MTPAFLITFREVIEASLIVATILGILLRFDQFKSVKTVWIATFSATLLSVVILIGGALLGVRVQELYEQHEAAIEGILMITSAIFITWAIFFLHTYFTQYKVNLLRKVKNTIEENKESGIFILTFTAVFREGIEIVLFLSTIYLADNPFAIFLGFIGGLFSGLVLAFTLFRSTIKIQVRYAFQVSSVLLILFAGGLIIRGIHEFNEIGMIPELSTYTIPFIPSAGTFMSEMVKAIFGITQRMNYVQLITYFLYITGMHWYVFFRKTNTPLINSVPI